MDNRTRLARLKKFKYMLENHDKIFGKESSRKKKIRFDMRHWYREQHSCGTIACALGSAALYPPFIKAGLKIRKLKLEMGGGWAGNVMYKGYQGDWAGAKFFGISQDEAEDLFYGSTHRRKTVAKLVGKLIAHYGARP